MMPPYRSRWPLAAALVVASMALPTAAAGADDDGVYGRFAGDLGVSLEAGIAEAFPGEAMAARLATHYLATVGTFLQYEQGLGSPPQPAARSIAFGVEVRPLFLPRFSSNLEQGPALLDLWLDSLGVELGVVGAALPDPRCPAAEASCWQTGLQVGVGMELPLLARAEGPFVGLRGALRWPSQPDEGEPEPFRDPSALAMLTVGYRLVFSAHLVDAGDRLR